MVRIVPVLVDDIPVQSGPQARIQYLLPLSGSAWQTDFFKICFEDLAAYGFPFHEFHDKGGQGSNRRAKCS
jgi:hypothetical protein